MEKLKKAMKGEAPNQGKGKKEPEVKVREDGSIITPEGKVLKKKVIPKKKIADDKGGLDWEVVDKKKTEIVEESDED